MCTWVCPWHRIEEALAGTIHHHCVPWAPRHGWWCCWTDCSSSWTWSRSTPPCPGWCRWGSGCRCHSLCPPCGPRHCHPGWGSTCLWWISDTGPVSHHHCLNWRAVYNWNIQSVLFVPGSASASARDTGHPPSVSKVPLTSLYSNPRLLLDQLLVSRSDLSLLHWEFFKLLELLPNNDKVWSVRQYAKNYGR